ncbi:uncharacterized protein [Apostichopus japonicus]|uniref:uncharacterized protein isoform X2 n=1 Tax=Stichopus japonicus TaxID=307972 RepID=UPI003AB828B1
MATTKTSVYTTIPRFTVQDGYNVSVIDVLDTGRLAVAGYNDKTNCSFIDLFMLKFDPDSQEKPLLLTSEPYYSEEFTEFGSSWRTVCLLDDGLFLTCCKDTIALYDSSSNGGMVKQGKFNGEAWCMTTRDGLVYVGLYSYKVIVLDARELRIKKTITLTGLEGDDCPDDITVSNNKLFICTVCDRRAYMFNSEGEIEQEYTNTQYRDARSITVSEEKGLIFILWMGGGMSSQVVVYSLSGGHSSISGGHSSISGGHILASFKVPDNSCRIRINNNINRLFLVTQATGEVYEYHTSDIFTFDNLLMHSESLIEKVDCQKLLDYLKFPAKESKDIIESDTPFLSLVHHLREAGKVSFHDINHLMIACSEKALSKLVAVLTVFQQAQDSKFTKKVPKDQLKALEDKRKELSHKLIESEGEKQLLTERLKASENERQQFTDKLAISESEKHQITGRLKAAEEERQQLSDKLTELEDERQQFIGRLKTTEEDRQTVANTLKTTEEERQQLTGRLKTTVNALKTTEEERQQLTRRLKTKEEEGQHLTGRLKTTEEKRQQLKDALKATEEEKQQLTGRLKTTEEERQQLTGRLKTTEEERQQLTRRIKTTEEERQQLAGRLKASEEERQQLTNKLVISEGEKHQINGSLTAAEEERQQLNDKLTVLEDERQQFIGQLKTTEEERQTLANTLKTTEEERQQLTGKIKTTEEGRQQFKDTLKSTEVERQQLTGLLKTTEDALKTTEEERQQLTRRIKTTEEERQQLVGRLKASEEERQQLTDKLAISEGEKHQINGSLKAAEEERQQLNDKLTVLEDERQQFIGQLKTTEEERQTLANTLKTTEGERQQLTGRLKTTKEGRQQFKDTLKATEVERQQLTGLLKTTEEEKQQLTGRLKTAEEGRQQLTGRLKKTEEERQQLAGRLKATEEKSKQFKDAWKATEEEKQQMTGRLKTTEEDRQQLNGRLKKTEEERQQLAGRLKASENERQQFTDKLAITEGEKHQITGRLKAAEEERKQLNDKITELEDERQQFIGQLKTTEEERQQLTGRLKTTEEERQQFKETLKATEVERQQLTGILKTTEEEKQQLTGRLKTTEEERQQLTGRLKTTEEERQQFKDALKATEEKRQQLMGRLKTTEEERQQLTGRLNTTEEEGQQFKDALKATEEKRQQLMGRLKTTEEERQQLTGRLNTTEEEGQQFKNTLTATEEERQQLTRRLKTTEEKRKQLTGRLKTTEEERQQLTRRLKTTEVEKKQLAGRLKTTEEERQHFGDRLNTTENKLKTLKNEHEEAKSSLKATKDELVKSQLEYAKEAMALQEVLKQTREALNQQQLAYSAVMEDETLLEERDTLDISQGSTLAADYGRLMVNVAHDLTLDSTLKLATLFRLPPAETDMLRRVSLIETPGITLINFMKTRNIINMYDVTNLQKGLVHIQLNRTNEYHLAPYQSKVDPFQFEENQLPQLLDWPVENVKFDPDNEPTPSQGSDEKEEDHDYSKESLMEREDLLKQRKDSEILEMRHHHSYIEHRITYEGGTISIMGVHLTIPEGALSVDRVIAVKVIYDPTIHLPGSARRGRMTPLIKLEPEGLTLDKPAQLTIPHSAIIPEPDRHDVIIFTGLKDEENLQEGEITWTEEKSIHSKLDPEKISLNINILSYVFVNLVNLETEQKHIFRIAPFIDGILDANDDVLITVCFCKDSDEEYKMMLEDHHSKLCLGNYTTFQITRTLNVGRDHASYIDMIMLSPGGGYHLTKEESTKHVDIDYLCAASRVSHQFRLNKNNDGGTDMVDVKLKVTQHEMNQTALILQSNVKDILLSPESQEILHPGLHKYKKLRGDVAKLLDKQHCAKLSVYFELKPAENETIQEAAESGKMLMKILDERELIMPDRMIGMYEGLKAIHFNKLATLVLKYIDTSQEKNGKENEGGKDIIKMVKLPKKQEVISKRESKSSVNFTILIEEGYNRLDVQRALKLSNGKLDLGRRLLILAKEEHGKERLPLFPESNLYKEQYLDHHGGEMFIAGVNLLVPAGALHTGRIVSLWVSTEPTIKGPFPEKSLRLTPFVKFGPESLTLHKPVTLIIPHCAFTPADQTGLDVYSGVIQTDKSIKWSQERKHLSCSMNSQHFAVEAEKPCLIGLHVPFIPKVLKRVCVLPIVNRVSESGDQLTIHLWFHNDDSLEHKSLINEEIYQQKGSIIHDPVSVQLHSMTSTLHVGTNSSTSQCNPRKVDVAMETLWLKNRHKIEFHLQYKGIKDTVNLDIEARYGMFRRNLFQLSIQLQIEKLRHIDQITSPFQLILPESIIKSFDQLKQNLSEHLDVDQSTLLANIFQVPGEGVTDIKKHKTPGTLLLEKLTQNSLISPTNVTKLENTLTEQGNEECAKLVRDFRWKNPVVQATMCPE